MTKMRIRYEYKGWNYWSTLLMFGFMTAGILWLVYSLMVWIPYIMLPIAGFLGMAWVSDQASLDVREKEVEILDVKKR